MSGRPATFTRGFGILSVSGRMRVPSPAASTMARRGVLLLGDAAMSNLQWRDVAAIPGGKRCQVRMRQRPLQVAPHARQMPQILRLVVTPLQPCKNAED